MYLYPEDLVSSAALWCVACGPKDIRCVPCRARKKAMT